MNFAKFLKTSFLQKTSGRMLLLLRNAVSNDSSLLFLLFPESYMSATGGVL